MKTRKAEIWSVTTQGWTKGTFHQFTADGSCAIVELPNGTVERVSILNFRFVPDEG